MSEAKDRFSGKVVIVTGAGSGIGAATARRFSREGALVAVIDQTEQAAAGTAADLDPARTMVHGVDVADPRAVDGMIDAVVNRFGRLDVLVNNAGIGTMGALTETTVEAWRRTIAVNVDGVFHCSRAAVPHLLKTRGCIVNVSSVSGLGGDWGMTAYNTSKGAVSNFTRSLALELGAHGVRVNAVNPSLTITGMTKDMAEDTALMERFMDRIPLGRAAQPDDIAAVIAFLASEDARFVTGVNLPVDGGVTASNGQPRMG